MNWADRLAALAAEKYPTANSAKSAKTPERTENGGGFGRNGRIGNGVESENDGGREAPAPCSEPGADPVVEHVMSLAPLVAAALAAPDVRADREAIAAAADLPPPPDPGPVPDDLIERWAKAMASPRPWQTIADPERVVDYFRRRAGAVLGPLGPLARGLLVGSSEAEARRWGG